MIFIRIIRLVFWDRDEDEFSKEEIILFEHTAQILHLHVQLLELLQLLLVIFLVLLHFLFLVSLFCLLSVFN
jgi:hypothetical protein